MSGFAANWLDLREPLDQTARSSAVADQLARLPRGEQPLRVVDLGAGTGANLRYLAPRLGGEQRWQAIDHDPSLLAALPERIGRWAGAQGHQVTEESAHRVRISGAGFTCLVETVLADMAASPGSLPFADVGLVTGSALLDLVSDAWLKALLGACRRARAAVLFALTYDGETDCLPEDADDARVLGLVNRHQRRDKGFGPALGPSASKRLVSLLRSLGYSSTEGRSDWRLGPEQNPLQNALIDGWASAASQLEPHETKRIESWRRRRLGWLSIGESRLTVGHRDVLAWPP